MICKSSLRLFGKIRMVNIHKLLRPHILSTPLRSFSGGNDPRDPKYTENQENHTNKNEFSEDKRNMSSESERAEDKFKLF